jgi:hypothetical protein
MGTFGSSNDKGLPKYIPTHQITGGCSIWKREIFDVVTFDLENRLHLFEDIDFSFRVDKIYSGRMFINTSAKIEDLFRESGARNFPERIYLRVLEARRIFDKYKDAGFISKDEYFYYMLGRALEALMISARELSLKPIISFFCGFKAKLKEIQSNV